MLPNISAIIVTTGLTSSAETILRAQSHARELGLPFVARSKRGVGKLLALTCAECALIVQEDRLMLSDGVVGYSYHPNMLLVRGLNALRDWRDLFLDAADLHVGERVLDCTLGFGCEASLAALAVGESGRVVGLEASPALALLTRTGLAEFELDTKPLRAAMRRVEVVCADYSAYLDTLEKGTFDLIAFDPFFNEHLEGSAHSIGPLARFGDRRPLDERAVLAARQIATRRVVVKHPRHMELAPELAAVRTTFLASRKGQTSYSIFDAYG